MTMTVYLYALSVCTALALAPRVVAVDNVEFGRAADPLTLKRRNDDKSYRARTALFGINRRKTEVRPSLADVIIEEKEPNTPEGADPSSPSSPINPSRPPIPSKPTSPKSPSTLSTPSSPTTPISPTIPSRPTNQKSPTTSTSPSNPTNPTNPNSPSTPSNPTNPMSPSMPSNPTNPKSPSTPSNPSNASNPGNPSSPNMPATPSISSSPNTPSSPSSSANPKSTSIPGSPSSSTSPKSTSPVGSISSPSTTSTPASIPTSSPGMATPDPTVDLSLPQAPSMAGGATPSSRTLAPTFAPRPNILSPTASSKGPSVAPTVTTATGRAISPTTVFDLEPGTGKVVLVNPPHEATTVVRLEIEYIVEGFFNNTNEFEPELDRLIFTTSVMASLGATDRGVLEKLPLSRRLESVPTVGLNRQRQLLSSSYFIRDCNNATIVNSDCFILGADIVYILNGEKNADFAAYLVYLALYAEMGTFGDDIPNVIRVEYLSPLPVLPEISVDDQESSGDALLAPEGTTLSFNPWTVAGAVAMSTGGLMALVIWNRNRRTRNRRHLQLLEDEPQQAPSSSIRESALREVVSHPL